MIGALYERFLRNLIGLSPRERGLLAFLAVVVVPLAIAYGLVLPVLNARQEARQALDTAQTLRRWVAAQADQNAALLAAPAPVAAPAGPPIGVSGIEESLIDAGLRDDVSRLANEADGGVSLGFEAVRFSALADWLVGVEPGWGYNLSAFTFTRADTPDTVSADFTLDPRK